ncbi:MAG TPA: GIY-YIG nuclease family protein [Blastocatellia bacterium]|nr:GIY-YIG nuclease family protein [Blastocatellia bacterium]
MVDKKSLKREYQQSQTPMGVFQIRNLVNGRVLVGSSLNLPGILNRHQFALQMGKHQNRSLQADWNEFGRENFAFEILDELTPSPDPGRDYRTDLNFLEELWLEKLEPFGDRGYNERKKSREERLGMIARRRSESE